MNLGLGGSQLGENATQAKRVFAQRRPHPFVACRCRVSLVEDEIDDLEHGLEPLRQLGAARDLERYARRGERALRTDDPLLNRCLRGEKRPRDLVGRQSAEQP